MKKSIIYISALLLFASCGSKQKYAVWKMDGERIPVVATNHPDVSMMELVEKYKTKLDSEMNIVIGQSSQDMPFASPESLLTNLTSDVMRQLDKKYTDGATIDFTVMNVNGHRASMPKGNITVGTIYEIYSFDNELAIVKLKGNDVESLFKSYARMGGAGISANVKLVISKDGHLISAAIDGQPVDPAKTYNIITLDYLADGNDGMDAFKEAVSVYKPGIILRDYMMDYVKEQTKRGNVISSKLDGRITVQ